MDNVGEGTDDTTAKGRGFCRLELEETRRLASGCKRKKNKMGRGRLRLDATGYGWNRSTKRERRLTGIRDGVRVSSIYRVFFLVKISKAPLSLRAFFNLALGF